MKRRLDKEVVEGPKVSLPKVFFTFEQAWHSERNWRTFAYRMISLSRSSRTYVFCVNLKLNFVLKTQYKTLLRDIQMMKTTSTSCGGWSDAILLFMHDACFAPSVLNFLLSVSMALPVFILIKTHSSKVLMISYMTLFTRSIHDSFS